MGKFETKFAITLPVTETLPVPDDEAEAVDLAWSNMNIVSNTSLGLKKQMDAKLALVTSVAGVDVEEVEVPLMDDADEFQNDIPGETPAPSTSNPGETPAPPR